MRIEIDENGLWTITSGTLGDPDYHQAQVQIGAGKVPYTVPNPTEHATMFDSLARDLTLPRNCWFKVANEWFPGTLHTWGTDCTDLGSYPIGVVEDETGKVHSLYVETIKMVRP